MRAQASIKKSFKSRSRPQIASTAACRPWRTQGTSSCVSFSSLLLAARPHSGGRGPGLRISCRSTLTFRRSRCASTPVRARATYWPISSGRAGYLTPRGVFRPRAIYAMVHSAKYGNAPMPHSIFFYGQYAIHGTNAVGSARPTGLAWLCPPVARRTPRPFSPWSSRKGAHHPHRRAAPRAIWRVHAPFRTLRSPMRRCGANGRSANGREIRSRASGLRREL